MVEYKFTNVKFHVDEENIIICDLEFVNEHGHPLKRCENVLFQVGREGILTDGEIGVRDDEEGPYMERAREKYGKNYPGWDVYNKEDFERAYLTWCNEGNDNEVPF